MKSPLLILCILLSLPSLSIAQSPKTLLEFGDSVEFSSNYRDLTLASFKGKAVVLVFFQSWCGICNGWAPEAIQEIEEAYSGSREVFFVALKTDGGGVSGAESYLKNKGADLSKWFVGSDADATLYKKLHGKDGLWEYSVIDPDGTVTHQSKVGRYYKNKKPKYSIAYPEKLKEYFGDTSGVLPASKTYVPELSDVIRTVELGQFDQAISMCQKRKTTPDLSPAASELEQDIIEAANARIKAQTDRLRNEEVSWDERYLAYQALSQMIPNMNRIPVVQKVKPFLARVRTHPEITKQLNAEAAFTRATASLDKANEQEKIRITGQLNNVANTYANTVYGVRAAELAAELSR